MADISKININDSSEYNIKDTTARDGLTDRPTSFVGTRLEWNALPVATQVKYSLVDLKGEGVYKNNGTGLELIADVGGETYTEITYEDWLELTDEEKATGKRDVTGVPGADGTISIDLMTKLWENPSPTQAFAAQDITLASDDYDLSLILCNLYTGSHNIFSYITIKGEGTITALTRYDSGASIRERVFTQIDSTHYAIGDAKVNSAINNNHLIPIIIYGIKLHHTVEIKAIAPEVSTSASKCMMSDGETSVEEALSYSETEHVVGKWIDGSTLYEKVYEVTNPTSGQTIETFTGVELKSIQALAKRTDGAYMTMPYYDASTSTTYRIFISVNVNGVMSPVIIGYSLSKLIIMVRYTKNS